MAAAITLRFSNEIILGALNAVTSTLMRDTDTEERPREGEGRDGRDTATSPGCLEPQKLKEAVRTLPGSLRMGHGSVHTLISSQ